MTLYNDYMSRLETLNSLKPKSTGRVAIAVVLSLIGITGLALWLTPWVQTAYGTGTISTLNAQDRIQAISALVPGQIKQWHVQEGQRVKTGDPIVTLADIDPMLLARLQSELSALEQKREANRMALVTAERELERMQNLVDEGLVSMRERDAAQIKMQEARATMAETDANLNQASTQYSRQSTQTKYAPQDGVITGLLAAGLATYVESGQMLAQFIPDDVERVVMIKANGLDAPLIQPGRKVRLQFEGWPVFQFSGWPNVAVGTFGGIVEFIEPVADANGQFNVWIKQDSQDAAWPDADFARLGSRAKAWVLLEEVRLGYEIWRQLNNFPPENPRTSAN